MLHQVFSPFIGPGWSCFQVMWEYTLSENSLWIPAAQTVSAPGIILYKSLLVFLFLCWLLLCIVLCPSYQECLCGYNLPAFRLFPWGGCSHWWETFAMEIACSLTRTPSNVLSISHPKCKDQCTLASAIIRKPTTRCCHLVFSFSDEAHSLRSW